MDKKQLVERTRQFAIRVFKLVDKLPKSESSKIVSFQLLKAALFLKDDEIEFLIKESDEFIAILSASVKTLSADKKS